MPTSHDRHAEPLLRADIEIATAGEAELRALIEAANRIGYVAEIIGGDAATGRHRAVLRDPPLLPGRLETRGCSLNKSIHYFPPVHPEHKPARAIEQLYGWSVGDCRMEPGSSYTLQTDGYAVLRFGARSEDTGDTYKMDLGVFAENGDLLWIHSARSTTLKHHWQQYTYARPFTESEYLRAHQVQWLHCC